MSLNLKTYLLESETAVKAAMARADAATSVTERGIWLTWAVAFQNRVVWLKRKLVRSGEAVS